MRLPLHSKPQQNQPFQHNQIQIRKYRQSAHGPVHRIHKDAVHVKIQ